MIYKIKYGNKEAKYGSWLPAMCFGDVLKRAMIHNKSNLHYPVEECLEQIFQNIIDELDYIDETDKGYSISDDDVDLTFQMLYHTEFGLMFEGTGKILTHPRRVYLEDPE